MTSLFQDENNHVEKPKKESKLLKPLLVILAVILIASGTGLGVWYWQNGELNKQRSDNDTRIAALQKQINDLQKKSTTTTIATTKPDETASWKTFTQSIFKFTIKYPAKYSVNSTESRTTKSLDQLVSMGGSIDIICTWTGVDFDYKTGATATTFGKNVFYKGAKEGKTTYSLLFQRKGDSSAGTGNLVVFTDNNNSTDIENILTSFKTPE